MGMQHFLDSWNTNEVGNNIKKSGYRKTSRMNFMCRTGENIFLRCENSQLRSLSFDIFRKLVFIEARPAWCGHWNRTFLWPSVQGTSVWTPTDLTATEIIGKVIPSWEALLINFPWTNSPARIHISRTFNHLLFHKLSAADKRER